MNLSTWSLLRPAGNGSNSSLSSPQLLSSQRASGSHNAEWASAGGSHNADLTTCERPKPETRANNLPFARHPSLRCSGKITCRQADSEACLSFLQKASESQAVHTRSWLLSWLRSRYGAATAKVDAREITGGSRRIGPEPWTCCEENSGASSHHIRWRPGWCGKMVSTRSMATAAATATRSARTTAARGAR
eukprot:COSAG04_NODE_12464_length_651_cov_1.148551_1_plen_190_part_01